MINHFKICGRALHWDWDPTHPAGAGGVNIAAGGGRQSKNKQ